MKPSSRSDQEAKALLDLASEEVMSLSDDEIRARATEEGVDIKVQGEGFRQLLQAKMKMLKLARLHRARQSLEAGEKNEKYDSHFLSYDEVRTRLAEFFRSGLVDPNSKLTLAFRGGTEMDEVDLRSLLADCEELVSKQRREEEG